jgi:DNA-binding NtrC family response regulator/predicted hydrocarbon binding protein
MRASDLDLRELLDFDPNGGVLRFAGQRALLFDAVALGLLRRNLIELLGLNGARAVLTRFGYAHGWRTAETLKTSLPWSDDAEWRIAGGRLHTLQGLVTVEPVQRSGEADAPFAEAIWRDSYEAEQHLLHEGRADEAVCWSLCGFASGYLSYANGREIYCLEETCVGKGDAVCRMVARDQAGWGERLAPHLTFFRAECLAAGLEKIAEQLKSTERRLRLRRHAPVEDTVADDPSGIIARSEQMKRVLELGRRAAKVDSTVLITGPSGAGKERIARLIHTESSRAGGPFVAINCAAVTDSLLESELFGHARGAFTGATGDRIGLFEAASGGTLFLDEVGEVPLTMQPKLLRALQEREIRRVGESHTRKIDVRVVAATNRQLGDLAGSGAFRQDLYYRLRVIELRVPALRDRKCDILPLARVFVNQMARQMNRRSDGLTPRAADQLVRYDWPGNVRELENAMERAVALSTGARVDLDDLPEEVRQATSPLVPQSGSRRLADIEREVILGTLEANQGNRARAADELGIGIATLYRKLKEYAPGKDDVESPAPSPAKRGRTARGASQVGGPASARSPKRAIARR